MARTKVPGKTAFYKRMRRKRPGITDAVIRTHWDAKKAKQVTK